MQEESRPLPYFRRFEHRTPPAFPPLSRRRARLWHFLAGVTIALSGWYLHWRWTASLNPDAMAFSMLVAGAETLFFLGTVIFFFDIWDEGDTPRHPASALAAPPGADRDHVSVDIFITTFDEDLEVVAPSIEAAKAVRLPENVRARIWLLDDGNREAFRRAAEAAGIGYITRQDNLGFKAGNLRNALYQTEGDFLVICDADTRLFPSFLENTLGYFADPQVAWVQTPHWFYDIPEGEDWAEIAARLTGLAPQRWPCRLFAAAARTVTGKARFGADPFLSDPALFFDVIQRRRNRNGASFCCGAGSIHRREAIFETALKEFAADLSRTGRGLPSAALGAVELQPFRFHVSEDIYTSLQLHSDPDRHWISVYHPEVESRMLSPWTMHAWATQRLKYAGGTFDILLRDNHLLNRGLPWRTKLHYLATYWSYLSALWAPVLLLAPAVSLFFGVAPVEAYSLEFFARFLPAVLASELAMIAACKGHDLAPGRIMATGGLAIQLRALAQVLAGRRPRFPPTPKTPTYARQALANLRYVWPNVALLALYTAAALWGSVGYARGWEGYSAPFLVVNLFWIAWSALAVGRIVSASLWTPPPASSQAASRETSARASISAQLKEISA